MEPIIHLLLPALVLYFLIPKHRKWVILLSFLSFIMDFDYFIPDYHRTFFHNLPFIAIVSLIIYIALGKSQFFISLYYLLSHLILDISDPGYSIFYPFSKTLYGINIFIKKALVNGWDYNISLIITPFGQVTRYSPSYYLTNTGLIFIIFLFLIVVTYYVFQKYENKA